RNINGPIPYAPDGLPLIGPMPGVPNAYEACVFTFGITQGGGAGKVLAEWIVEGETEWDMWAVDPRRYTDYTDQDYCNKKAMEVYGHEYAMHFPYHEWPAARDKKLSPVDAKVRELGGVMGAYSGWERANWFAQMGDDTSLESTETWSRHGPWEQRIKEECEAVRDHCGMLPITGFSRFRIEGPGARAFVDSLTASKLPNPGRVSLAYFPDSRGRILTETSVAVHSDDHVGLITAATAQWHDAEIFSRQAPEGITVTDRTKEVECLLVTGPKAREILEPLTEGHDLTASWLSASTEGSVAGQPCAMVRVSFAGELGWEIHCPPGHMPPIWDALAEAGVTPFGMYALNSLRIEKGYRAWKGDLSTDYSLLEAGLDRFIKFDKPQDFPGKAALLNERQQGLAKQFVTLKVEANGHDAPYMATLWNGDEIVGETTSGAWGYRVGHSVALGMLRTDLAVEGTELQVDIYGQKCRAIVQPAGPLWDPKNERLRA
ncbi:MAG: glycine cleavage T C-terminal barrel domain-containing protein, partial [Pseudomonadota bacterium]